MKLLFDNNAFAYVVQQPQLCSLLSKLKEKTKENILEVIGTITFFEELMGLAQHNLQSYHNTLSHYQELTGGKILNPWNYLMQMEIEKCCPLTFKQSILDEEDARKSFELAKDPKESNLIFDKVYIKRQKYKNTMGETAQNILEDPLFMDKHRKEIMRAYKGWFENFENLAQEWFERIFYLKQSISYKKLPHVRSFMSYLLTRIYERLSLNIPDKATDLYDRAYFTEAAAADILITNDNAFIRTCSRVPYKSFEVITIDELEKLISFGTLSNKTE